MAIIRQCKYCPKLVTNAPWHQECRLAKIEGLLYRIRKQLNISGRLDPTISVEILDESFRSKEEIELEYRKVEERKLAKEHWKNAFDEEIQQFVVQWQKEHPDPDPPTC